MKAYRITGGTEIKPLAFPSLYRKGDVPPDAYRKQASGEIPKANLNLSPARFMRTIQLKDGSFSGLANEPGALLNFVIAGQLTLTAGTSKATLGPGEFFLLDAQSGSRLGVSAQGGVRLIQLGIASDWPGADSKIQDPGTITERAGGKVNIKRVIKKDDDLAYMLEFPELFPAHANEWSKQRQITGFRFMCWEDGFLDWHPEVVSNLGMILSGEIELEMSGDHARSSFRTGDICLCEDRTGVGHIDWAKGATHVGLIVLPDDNVW